VPGGSSILYEGSHLPQENTEDWQFQSSFAKLFTDEGGSDSMRTENLFVTTPFDLIDYYAEAQLQPISSDSASFITGLQAVDS
jgi:hypothetical protein